MAYPRSKTSASSCDIYNYCVVLKELSFLTKYNLPQVIVSNEKEQSSRNFYIGSNLRLETERSDAFIATRVDCKFYSGVLQTPVIQIVIRRGEPYKISGVPVI